MTTAVAVHSLLPSAAAGFLAGAVRKERSVVLPNFPLVVLGWSACLRRPVPFASPDLVGEYPEEKTDKTGLPDTLRKYE